MVDAKENKSQPSEVMGFTIGREEEGGGIFENETQKKTPHFTVPKLSLPALPRATTALFALIPLFIVGLCVALLFFFHTAQVIITVPLEKKSSEITIQTSDKPTKVEQVELQTFATPFSINEKKETTGKKDIGEKAAGEVTLYSYEEKEKQLAKATKLEVDSLAYETDDAVTIPSSQFAADGITKNPGKAKVKIRATVLGTESNLDKNKRFSVSGSSSNIVFGINEAALTGGTKKTVRTISKTDIDNLKSFALDKAKQEALSKQKTETAFLLISELSSAVAKKEQLSGEVGEEAESLRYIASGTVNLSRIPRKAILDSIEKKLENEKPEGFKTESVTFTVSKQKKLESGDIQLTIGGEIIFSKILDADIISKAITGKGRIEGEALIQSQFGVIKVDLSISPNIPLIQDRMPFWTNHIRVELIR